MQSSITLDDVLASATKYQCVLEADYKKVRDLKKLNPKAAFDTTYIPLLFKHINGKNMKVKIKFSEQMIASGAKIPQGSDEEGIAKNLNISFMQLKREDIEGGDYVPKVKKTELEQIKENKRISDNITRYMENNVKFLQVLDIIDKSYKTVCSELKEKEKTFDFRIKKDRKQTDIVVYSMKQSTRLNKDTNEDEKLEIPIYRLKVPVCKKDGRIGIWSNYNNEFKPTVFDARKMTKKNNYQPVSAKVKVNGKSRDLDVNNASSFIVYKSLVGGTISFECIVASKFGLSLSNSFFDLYVFRHKAKLVQQTISKEEILAMRGGEEEEDDESDAEVETNTKVNDDDEEEDDDDDDDNGKEPHDSDDDNENSQDSSPVNANSTESNIVTETTNIKTEEIAETKKAHPLSVRKKKTIE
jgi:hypothetical protein